MIIGGPKKEIKLVVGGESRIELLPREVAARKKARSTRRALVGVVVLAGLVAGGGYGFASIAAGSSAALLAAEQSKTSVLILKQGDFIEVERVEQQLNTAAAARQVAVSTEIGWKGYLAEIQGSLPVGVGITSLSSDSETPLQIHPQPTAPLQGERVATLVFEAVSPTIPDIKQWLDGLGGVTGFVDAVPGSIEKLEEGGYSVTLTMHINSNAYANRYTPTIDAPEETATPEETETP